jgi:hypothetical protein
MFSTDTNSASSKRRPGTAAPVAARFSGTICVRLETGWAIAIFACISVFFAALFIVETIDIAGSETLAASMRLRNLTRAVALWPGNPDFHYRTSTLIFSLSDHQDMAEALKQARIATELGPAWVRHWGQLAWICAAAGDSHCGDSAVERIRSLAPMDPEAISLTANYYLQSGRPALALKQFQRLLQVAPDHAHDVFRVCDSAGYSTEELEQTFVAADPQVAIAYISYLAGHNKVDAAHQLWTELVRKADKGDFPLTPILAAPYVDRLLQLGDSQELQNVRLDLEKLKLLPGAEGPGGNLVFNGDFEQLPANKGFDWRKSGAPYPVVNFAAENAYSGKRCMRVDFTVARNDTYLLAYQMLPLQANSHYRLSAYVRSDGITSDRGPRLQIYDPLCRGCLDARSESTVGTTPWHEIHVDFSTGPTTRLGQLEVVRLPGRFFPRDITGTFWLDKVSLKPVPDEPSI